MWRGALGDPGFIFLAPQIDRKPRRFSGAQERKKARGGRSVVPEVPRGAAGSQTGQLLGAFLIGTVQ